MPEGDSYVRAADRLRATIVGHALTAVDGVPAVRRRAGDLVGRRVESVRTVGKHLLVDVEGGLTIHVSMGMPGRWRISARRGRDPSTGGRGAMHARGAMRLLLETDDHRAVCSAAPTVEIERRRVVDAALERLGPDLLAEEPDLGDVVRRSTLVPPSTLVSDLLLDQRVMAGIGNEYKSEVLFLERIHPETVRQRLDDADVERLARRARRIMLPNAARPGPRATTGLAGRGRELWVYGRTGRPCRRCRTPVVEGWIGERYPRITYWCPACQPRPGPP